MIKHQISTTKYTNTSTKVNSKNSNTPKLCSKFENIHTPTLTDKINQHQVEINNYKTALDKVKETLNNHITNYITNYNHRVHDVNRSLGLINDDMHTVRLTTNEHLTYIYHITNTIIPIVTQTLSPSKTTAIQTKIEKTLNYHNATITDHIIDDDDNTEQ